MTIEYMRRYISDQYPSPSWKTKCKYMHENQVMGIYYSMMEREEKKALQNRKDLEGYQFKLTDYL